MIIIEVKITIKNVIIIIIKELPSNFWLNYKILNYVFIIIVSKVKGKVKNWTYNNNKSKKVKIKKNKWKEWFFIYI